MKHAIIIRGLAACVIAAGWAASAHAQYAQAPVVPPAAAQAKAVTMQAQIRAGTASGIQAPAPEQPAPTVRLFGLPLRISAPVPPPYGNSAYRDLAGQPETGADNLMAQTEFDH